LNVAKNYAQPVVVGVEKEVEKHCWVIQTWNHVKGLERRAESRA